MSAISWGFKAAATTVLVMLGLWLLYRVVGLGFAIVIGMLAGFAFAVAVAVVLVRRLIGAGIERFAEILKVGQDERYDRSDEMASEIAAAPSQGGDELREVAERIRRLTKAAHGIVEPRLSRAVDAVAAAGERLLAKAVSSRGDARRLRPALVHRLRHVEAVTLNILRMQDSGATDPELVAKASATLERLAEDFERQRRNAAAEALETEARLKLLEQELGASAGRRAAV